MNLVLVVDTVEVRPNRTGSIIVEIEGAKAHEIVDGTNYEEFMELINPEKYINYGGTSDIIKGLLKDHSKNELISIIDGL
jgi:hypothetical protein